jgi:hypothetical protein
MKTLDAQWLAAKLEHDKLAKLYGPRSKRAQEAFARMMNLTNRILARDNRKRKAA